MEREYTYLLHLLGAYLRGAEPETDGTVDWDKLTKLAQIHGVPGILGYMAMKYPICPDAGRKTELRGLCLSTISVFARRMAMAEALVAELEKAGIDHILMKGYVLRDFYPVPELRTFNDIDVVIRKEDRKRCDDLMISLGFQRHADWEPVYSYAGGNALYEIHTDIMEIDVSDKADYKGYFSGMWNHARPDRLHSFRFTPEFHFLYMLTHIAKHVHGSGAGVRMYLDVAAFVLHYGDGIDWDQVGQELDKLRLRDFAGTVLGAVERWFGVKCPIAGRKVPAEVLEEFTAYTLEAGTFGHHERDGALASLKHTDQEAPRMKEVLRKTFPDAKTIESRYTYLQDKPWLLPAAWVHRLVKNREKLGIRTRQMGDILRADQTEVGRLKKLMKDIGL